MSGANDTKSLLDETGDFAAIGQPIAEVRTMSRVNPPDASADAVPRAHWQVTNVGSVAAQLLARYRQGTLLAVFERSVYIRLSSNAEADRRPATSTLAQGDGYDADNALICIADNELGAGPLQVCVNNFFPRPVTAPSSLEAGQAVTIDADGLTIHSSHSARGNVSAGCFLSFADAARRVSTHTIKRCADPEHALRRLAQTSPMDLGIAPGLQDEHCGARSKQPLCALHEWLSQVGTQGDGRHRAPAPVVFNLVGLGIGLTPAGDDYLAGVVIGLHYCRRDAAARILCECLHPALKERTNRISRAHLACVCTGQYQAVIVELLAALDESSQELGEAVTRLSSYGHTSGMDLLGGFAAALNACKPCVETG